MTGAEAAIDGRHFAAPARKPFRPRLAAFFRKIHLMKPEPTLEQQYENHMKKAVESAKYTENMEDALWHIEKAIACNKSQSEPYVIRGMMHMDLKRFDLAKYSFDLALFVAKRNSGTGMPYYSLFLEQYMQMRYTYPAPGVKTLCYIPVKDALSELSMELFGRAESNLEYAIKFAKNSVE